MQMEIIGAKSYSSTQIGKKLVTIELDLIGIQLEWDFKNLLLQWISLLILSMWNLNLISDPSSTKEEDWNSAHCF